MAFLREECRRKLLHLNFKVLPGAPNELWMVVSGSGLKSLETSELFRLGCMKTLFIRVTESNQGGGRTMVRRPLKLGEHDSGSRKIGGILQQLKACGSGNALRNWGS